MSSYIVSDRTINSIVTYIEKEKANEGEVSRLLMKYGYNHLTKDGLANKLLEMNYNGTNQRYNEHKEVPKIEFNYENVNDFQVLKNMHCLRFQASEGNVPDTKMFRFLDELTDIVSRDIVENLPAYRDAAWGMDAKILEKGVKKKMAMA
jgi:hypothetical protein